MASLRHNNTERDETKMGLVKKSKRISRNGKGQEKSMEYIIYKSIMKPIIIITNTE